jgi:hypothetical protein
MSKIYFWTRMPQSGFFEGEFYQKSIISLWKKRAGGVFFSERVTHNRVNKSTAIRSSSSGN